MNFDQFFFRTFDEGNYNCAHFVAEVWEHITGDDITSSLSGFLLPPAQRTAPQSLRTKFKATKQPSNPAIVMMRNPNSTPHVGIYFNSKVAQITKEGVEYQPLSVATRGFKLVRFYRCLNE